MPFQTVPINVAGPTYRDRSKPLSVQESRNIYPEIVEEGKEQFVMKSFPGQLLLDTVIPDNDRGSHQMLEVAYRVVGNSLYEVSQFGNHALKGTVPGTGRCIFADDGITLYIVADGIVSHYNSSNGILDQVTDSNIIGAQSVTFINNFFAYTFPTRTQFSFAGDGSQASGLDAIAEESNPDDLVRDYAFDQVLYRFGTRTCPNWYNSGVGSPPFDKIEGQIINTGLAAIHSVANNRQFIYWLGTDLQVYRARSGQEISISSSAMAAEIQKYDVTFDAVGYTFTMDNKDCYLIDFPAQKKTWCLIEELDQKGWFELSEGIEGKGYNAGSILEVYGKVFIGNKKTGQWSQLSFDRYDLNSQPWRRRRVLGTISGDTLQAKGKRVQMSRMVFILESGVGILQGQGEDPKIMVEASYDGGNTWNPGTWMRIGRQGQYIRAEWFSMRSFYTMEVRLTTSDPIAVNIYSATIDIQVAGL